MTSNHRECPCYLAPQTARRLLLRFWLFGPDAAFILPVDTLLEKLNVVLRDLPTELKTLEGVLPFLSESSKTLEQLLRDDFPEGLTISSALREESSELERLASDCNHCSSDHRRGGVWADLFREAACLKPWVEDIDRIRLIGKGFLSGIVGETSAESLVASTRFGIESVTPSAWARCDWDKSHFLVWLPSWQEAEVETEVLMPLAVLHEWTCHGLPKKTSSHDVYEGALNSCFLSLLFGYLQRERPLDAGLHENEAVVWHRYTATHIGQGPRGTRSRRRWTDAAHHLNSRVRDWFPSHGAERAWATTLGVFLLAVEVLPESDLQTKLWGPIMRLRPSPPEGSFEPMDSIEAEAQWVFNRLQSGSN